MEQKKSSTGLIIGIIVVVIVGIFVWRYFSGKTAVNDQASGEQNGQVINLSDYIFMVNQKPGRFVNVSKVILSKKGYVAIHQEEAGKAGAVIGYSNLLNSGESKNFSVTLNRKSVAGESFYAMVHWDNSNGTFNPAEDVPATDKEGNVVAVKFIISDSASEPIEYKM
ncbi:MAG: hypothetical protein AAB818_01230 [Patescibacteria group bacterium]